MRRIVLFALVIAFAINANAQEKPNIVLLFVDDYGWSDIGYRNASFETPNLDKLKKESLDFQRAYIPTPTCSPSRLSLLTGKEAVRLQMVRHIHLDPNKPDAKYGLWKTDPVQMPSLNYLPLEEVTYAEKIKEHGYYNHFVGKWHLGHTGRYPVDQGFDSEFGVTDAGHPKSYYFPFFKAKDDPKGFVKNYKKGDYLTNVLTDGAVDFIQNYDKENPFMLTFWYYSVHGPSVGRKDLLKKYQARGIKGKYAHHHAMVEAMDESVGRVRKALEDKGIADNTVIIVLSDQGGAYPNDPLRGGKKGGDTLAEGGARVPFMVYYPGVTTPSESFTPVQSIDVFPTVVEIASGKKCKNKDIQGVSLMPLIKGEKIKKRNIFGFRSYEDQYTSIINGDWKIIKYHSGKYQMYNVAVDQSEQNDLIGKGLPMEKKLKKSLAKWEKEAVPAFGPHQLNEK